MDILTLYGLQYYACHCVYENERIEGNGFEVDLIFCADLNSAVQQDDLPATIDCEEAECVVRKIMEGPSAQLLQTLVHKIGQLLLDTFTKAQKVTVKLRKLHPPLPTPAQYSQLCRTWKRS